LTSTTDVAALPNPNSNDGHGSRNGGLSLVSMAVAMDPWRLLRFLWQRIWQPEIPHDGDPTQEKSVVGELQNNRLTGSVSVFFFGNLL
jgi:hypothetical protein